jgi:hypothetical protein
MFVSVRREISEKMSARLVAAAGWLAIGMGVVHVVVAPLEEGDLWAKVVDEGVWNTFTIDVPATPGQFERAAGFWSTFGSWAVPVLALGCYVLWSARQYRRVPGWLGWIFLAWGLPLAIVCPTSPGWAFPIIGGLIVLGDRRRSRFVSGPPPETAAGTDQPDASRQGIR